LRGVDAAGGRKDGATPYHPLFKKERINPKKGRIKELRSGTGKSTNSGNHILGGKITAAEQIEPLVDPKKTTSDLNFTLSLTVTLGLPEI